MEKCLITFQPSDKEIEVPRGTNLLAAATQAGIHIYNSCGGEGVCGRCKVIIKKGQFHTELSGRLSPIERAQGYVLACRTTPKGETLEVEVPLESRLDEAAILTEEAKLSRLAGLYSSAEEVVSPAKPLAERVFTRSPLSTKLFFKLPPPTLEDNISDLERLYREIQRIRGEIPIMQIGLANIKSLDKLLRDSNWQVTITLGNRNKTVEVVLVEPGDTTRKNFGIALDIGTTTVVAYLVDLNSGKTVGGRASYNKQVDFGEDVISRIIFAQESEGLERLHHAVIDTVNDLIGSLSGEYKVSLNDINAAICAGNTTMTHLLLKVDPTYIRRAPYVPAANFVPVIRAAEAGIKINPRGLLWCVPGVSSYVGGDITSGVLASGIDEQDELSMLIDLGTNGEIVLGNKEWLISCSTSAGPCFEGGGITCGLRAMKGAVQKVQIGSAGQRVAGQGPEVKVETIGNAKPIGICGSGLISAIGEMFKAGLIDRSGKLREKEEFVLVKSSLSATGKRIIITNTDIQNVIRSKGAIFTGAWILLRQMQLRFEDIKHIYISGGLGTSLDIEDAIYIGLLPDLPKERFQFIGNSSVSGAKMVLLSMEAMTKAEEIARKTMYIDLSTTPDFMNNYSASLFLPHTDLGLFPSVVTK